MRLSVLAVMMGLAWPAAAADLPRLVEPSLHLPASAGGETRVALTFDACDGRVDHRILDLLEQKSIPATVFVSGKWLARNAEAFAEMKAHPDLFEIEDHGARHIPAVDYPTRVYGLKAAGSPAAVLAEVKGGADQITAAGGPAPAWFRGATAKYDSSAMAEIRGLGLQVAGYSLNGDSGASVSAAEATRRFGQARDGDVIIAHINQPTRAAGAGVAAGIAALQAKGVVFVRLEDAIPAPLAETTRR